MLIKNHIQIPSNISVIFIKIINERFLCLKNMRHDQIIYVKIPSNLFIIKENNILKIETKIFDSFKDTNLKTFNRFLTDTISSLRVLSKKIITVKGLGLKISLDLNILQFKLGYSHLIFLDISKQYIFVKVYKKFMVLSGFNKIKLGNNANRIFQLKKADSYKGRGLFLKDKIFILKPVKKT